MTLLVPLQFSHMSSRYRHWIPIPPNFWTGPHAFGGMAMHRGVSTGHKIFGRWLMLLVVWLGIEEQVHGMKFWTGSMTHACRWWYGGMVSHVCKWYGYT